MSLFGKRLKKFAVVSSILAAFGGFIYYVVMSISDIAKSFEDAISDDDEF
jgi:hypothetical protein